jgi:hypothetical protein
VLWNTIQIERVVGRLRTAGAEIDPADLAHVWPLQHARIIPNGTYFLGWPELTKRPPDTHKRTNREFTRPAERD